MYRGKHRDKQNGNIYMWINKHSKRAISTNNSDLFIIGLFKCVLVNTISNEQMIVNNEFLSVCKEVLWSNVGRNYKNLSHNTWHPCQDLKLGPAKHKEGVPMTETFSETVLTVKKCQNIMAMKQGPNVFRKRSMHLKNKRVQQIMVAMGMISDLFQNCLPV